MPGVICVSHGEIPLVSWPKVLIRTGSATFAQGEIPDILEDVSRIGRRRQKTQN
jgi:hypothetical protein